MNEDTPSEAAQPAMQRAEPAGLDSGPIGWAWAQSIANNPGARIVLMCLAGRVDETWQCIASQEEVAVDAMMSARSVRRHLEQLEAEGFIARQRRFDDKGHRLPDLCRVNPTESLPANLSGRGESNRPDCPVANLPTGPEQAKSPEDRLASGQDGLWPDWPVGDGPETDIRRSGPVANLPTGQIGRASSCSSPTENNKEKNNNNPSSTKKGGAGGKRPRTPSTEEHPRFAEWYAAYPLRKERAAASAAFKKAVAKVEDVQILFDASKRYEETDPYVLRGFIKNPATWLNKECWLDEPGPPALTVVNGNGAPSPGSRPQNFTEEDYLAGWK